MYSATVVVLSLAVAASAQSFGYGGVGRFPCSRRNAQGTITVDLTACNAATISSLQADGCEAESSGFYGDVDGGGFKNYGLVPTGSTCSQYGTSGDYYCGIAGSVCTSNANCDNGSCQAGVCVGDLAFPCTLDSQCSGNFYCLNNNAEPVTAAGSSCGLAIDNSGNGAICDDGCAGGNFLCQSGVCDGTSGSCFLTLAGASQRARSRRDVLSPRGSRCPASHTACPVSGAVRGFECIDTTSNLEQCGACASQGGVDCTSLPGVDAVGCVAGQCEIWACAESHVWDASSASCVLALVSA